MIEVQGSRVPRSTMLDPLPAGPQVQPFQALFPTHIIVPGSMGDIEHRESEINPIHYRCFTFAAIGGNISISLGAFKGTNPYLAGKKNVVSTKAFL